MIKHDPDYPESALSLIDHGAAREAKLKKTRAKKDKVMGLKEAIAEYVADGDSFVETGFGAIRGPMAAYFEIGRQGKKNLTVIATPGAASDFLIGMELINKAHIAYYGAEMRGLAPSFRRKVEEGKFQVLAEWSHHALSLALRAAELGVNAIACKSMLGSDMLKHNNFVKVQPDPFSGEPVVFIPAIYPDFAIIHVNEADQYGNARILGPTVNDTAIAVAAKKVILTTERLVSTETLRREPDRNKILYYCVDAVCEVEHGAFPSDMPGEYYFDRELMEEVIRVTWKEPDKFKEFVENDIHGCDNHYDFIMNHGGLERLHFLKKLGREAAGFGAGAYWKYNEVAKKGR